MCLNGVNDMKRMCDTCILKSKLNTNTTIQITTTGNYYNKWKRHNYKNNMRKSWRVIKETLNKMNQKTNLPMCIEHNNTLLIDPNKIANTFNIYFENISGIYM